MTQPTKTHTAASAIVLLNASSLLSGVLALAAGTIAWSSAAFVVLTVTGSKLPI